MSSPLDMDSPPSSLRVPFTQFGNTAKIEPLLPPRPPHPLGRHSPLVPDRFAMEAILLVLRMGMQWQALKAPGVCHSSSAHCRFREWLKAGVFHEFWRLGLVTYEALVGIDWQLNDGEDADGTKTLVLRAIDTQGQELMQLPMGRPKIES